MSQCVICDEEQMASTETICYSCKRKAADLPRKPTPLVAYKLERKDHISFNKRYPRTPSFTLIKGKLVL